MLPSSSVQKGSQGWEPIASPRYGQAPRFDSSFPTADSLAAGQAVELAMSATVRPLQAHSTPEYDDESEPSFVRVDFTTKESTPSVISVELKYEDMYRHVQHEFHWTCMWANPSVRVEKY
jgi:hypothetical protein